MRAILASMALLGVAGCQVLETPGVALSEAGFAEGPVIIQRGDRYYLNYRRSPRGDDGFKGRQALGDKKDGDALYFFFLGQTSFPEEGNTIEMPLNYGGYEEFARRGQVFWLDPDGTKHPIPVRREP